MKDIGDGARSDGTTIRVQVLCSKHEGHAPVVVEVDEWGDRRAHLLVARPKDRKRLAVSRQLDGEETHFLFPYDTEHYRLPELLGPDLPVAPELIEGRCTQGHLIEVTRREIVAAFITASATGKTVKIRKTPRQQT